MTDNKIIKAWEHIRDVIELDEEPSISIELITNTLDLIKSKNVEIERLNAKIKSIYKELERVALMTVATDEKEMVGE